MSGAWLRVASAGQASFRISNANLQNKPGIYAVQYDVGEVITEAMLPPQNVIQAKTHPGQRNVVLHQMIGPHPAELHPSEASKIWIID
jgi:hypothetical protein